MPKSINPLSLTHPLVAAEWHPVKNGGLSPDSITQGSAKVVWWQGTQCGHEWDAKVCVRTGQMQGCPYCNSKRVLAGFNDLATSHPHLVDEWHPVKNDDLTPQMVVSGSERKVWWRGECGHEWETNIRTRAKSNANCPYCSGQKVLLGFNDLATTHPNLASLWDYGKNGGILPTEVNAGSKKKRFWVCPKGHTWESPVAWQAVKEGEYCRVCAGNILSPGSNDLATLYPNIADQWHPMHNGSLTPQQVTPGAHKKVWWLGDCGHEWEAVIKNRASGKASCPVCCGQRILVGFNDLATTYPDVASEWHETKNNPLTAKDVTFGANKKVWWKCGKKGHEWFAYVSGRTTSGYGCPECAMASRVSKAEQEIADFVAGLGLMVEPSNRKVLGGVEIDIYLPEKKFGIEYNGLYWHTEDMGKAKSYHYDKWLKAKSMGIQLVQIWEDEWLDKPEVVKSMLKHKLGLGSASDRVFARKTRVALLSTKQAKEFFGTYHIQGFASGSLYYGLVEGDDVVSAVIVKREHGDVFNIIRYASAKSVVGGFTKLLAYIERNHDDFASFSTFSDHCVSDGGLYANNGFIADKELAPDYRYVVGMSRAHKFGYRLKKFRDDPNLLWQEGLTERELAKLNGLPRIWDAGKTRWVKHIR